MIIKNLSLVNFKNHLDGYFDFHKNINCLVGNNGVGKTNILDAIYYLAFCKSFLNAVDSNNITYEKSFFLIKGVFVKDDEEDIVSCGFKRGDFKRFKKNEKIYKKLSDHIGYYPLVLISPLDSEIILSGSSVRRKFIDSVISQFDKQYLSDLISYNKVLKQRNMLLKQSVYDDTHLKVYNDELVKYGNNIFVKRKDFINEFVPVLTKYYNYISSSKETIQVNYKSDLLNFSFNDLLEKNLHKDKILKYTCSGVHRDDLDFFLNTMKLKKSGSQGQQKSFMISMKFAKYEYIKQKTKLYPSLLLDDIFDKLDNERCSRIIELVNNESFGQIFITHTCHDTMKDILNRINSDYIIFNF